MAVQVKLISHSTDNATSTLDVCRPYDLLLYIRNFVNDATPITVSMYGIVPSSHHYIPQPELGTRVMRYLHCNCGIARNDSQVAPGRGRKKKLGMSYPMRTSLNFST